MNTDVLDKFVEIVGERHALRTNNDIAPFVEDARGRFGGSCSLVLRPSCVEEVSRIMTLATKTKTPIIPQGGNTGLVGGGLPLRDGNGDGVILSLGRMNKIIQVDEDTNTITVEAGVILENIQNAADDIDRLFPLSLGAQGSCKIGGNISTNAGGTGVLAYGNTRDLVMGLEVVLASGEILNGLSKLRKDNTGYDLKN
ncbi:MAG: FAD-binding oxidoreductase, partial [Rhizobiaceae bacterium]